MNCTLHIWLVKNQSSSISIPPDGRSGLASAIQVPKQNWIRRLWARSPQRLVRQNRSYAKQFFF